ncbi:MAG TPA: hypothetical protein VI756_20580 [Blastocatellia bacterium]
MVRNIMNMSIAVFFLTASVCTVVGTHDFHSATGRLHGTLENVDDATGSLKNYVAFQTAQLESDRYQRMIEASIQTPAIFNASGRTLNTQVLPAARDELRALGGATSALTSLINELKDNTVPAANASLSELTGTLKGLSDLEARLGLTVDDTNQLIAEVSKQSGMAADEIKRRLDDPRVDQLLDNLASTTGHLNGIVANGEKASEKWPAITDAINKASQASAKAAKFYWAARIVSLIVGALPLP